MSRIADLVFDLACVAAVCFGVALLWTEHVVFAKALATAALVAFVALFAAAKLEERWRTPTRPDRPLPRPEPRQDYVSEEEHAETRLPR